MTVTTARPLTRTHVHPASFLLVTLDSCRYDTYVEADIPVLRSVGEVHQAMAPGNFTYSSHQAMFVGFTPGVAGAREPWLNPKYARIFRIGDTATGAKQAPFAALSGRSVVDGFRRSGYRTVGAGAMRWFDPSKPASRSLIQDFDDFVYTGVTSGRELRRDGEGNIALARQLRFVQRAIDKSGDRPVFVFLNVGETHVPYYHDGAPWSSDMKQNPCKPWGADNDAAECMRRQRACLEFVDARIQPLLDRFAAANTIVTSDHGDAWGEDGVWEHGVSHPKVLEVPLTLRLNTPPGQWQADLQRRPLARARTLIRRALPLER